MKHFNCFLYLFYVLILVIFPNDLYNLANVDMLWVIFFIQIQFFHSS